MPFFSIIMPCYNAEAILGAAIESVLAQSCSDWELICVNDGSEDGTQVALESWATCDSRIKIMQIENRGPAMARNLGAGAAEGEILCFLDADDLWDTHKLSQLTGVFANPEIGGAFGVISFFNTPGTEITRSSVTDTYLTIPQLMGENPVGTMSNLSLRKSEFLRCGGLAHGFVHNEDLEWLIRLVGMGCVIQPVNQRQVWYRKSQGGLSADLLAMAESRRKALRTAAYFGFKSQPQHEAIYLRYLARRALRLNGGAASARAFTLNGLKQSPRAFLMPPKRGLATAIASLIAPLLPSPLRRALFS